MLHAIKQLSWAGLIGLLLAFPAQAQNTIPHNEAVSATTPVNGCMFFDQGTTGGADTKLCAPNPAGWATAFGFGPLTTSPSISAALDTIGSTQGGILYRGASLWSYLAPGTSGQFLQTQGAGLNPLWAPGTGGGGGGTFTLGAGLASTPTTYNPGTQTVTGGGTIYPQLLYEAHATSCTINSTCGAANDSGKLLTATGAGVTFTTPTPGAVGTAGYAFGYDGSHTYSLTTPSGTIYGNCGPTGATLSAISFGTSLTPDGSNWQCTPFGSGTGASLSANNTWSGQQTFGTVVGTETTVTLSTNNYLAVAADCGTTKLLPTGTTPTVTLPNLNQSCTITFITTVAVSYQFVAATGGSTQNSLGFSHSRGTAAGDTVSVTVVTPSGTAAKWNISGDLTS